eukprot:3077347-Rhodomonas_salina.2
MQNTPPIHKKITQEIVRTLGIPCILLLLPCSLRPSNHTCDPNMWCKGIGVEKWGQPLRQFPALRLLGVFGPLRTSTESRPSKIQTECASTTTTTTTSTSSDLVLVRVLAVTTTSSSSSTTASRTTTV